jgi:UDP-N-acetylmuramoyl-L-alanyl-D-glutamate--2,6-diaminopimelate ligase
LAEAVLWNVKSGFPARGMKVIGVTGTNGKTTTAFMIHRMLQTAGYRTGLMTTVAYGVGEVIRPQVHHMTNVPVPELMRRLRWMRGQGVEWLVLETTSQALAQNRVWGVPYSIAVMTNVTHEHLDYHRTFERYRDAKRRLFQLANRNAKGLRAGIINADDPSAELFVQDILHPITYGIEKGSVRAQEVRLAADGSTFVAEMADERYRIRCRLPGTFNVSNALAAVCVGRVVGLTKRQIEQGIAALPGVEGRMTTINEGQRPTVIVDFAHTPDAFEKLFKDLRPAVRGKLIVLFGSAGRRDEAKRAVQGELAGKYADEVVITEEDDRDADGLRIMDEIAAGAEAAGKVREKDLFLVHSRAAAITFAIGRGSSAQDTVLLLGKGHEKTIERSDGEHAWDEIGTARKAARKLARAR